MRVLWVVPLVAACNVPEVEYRPLVRELVVELPVTLNRKLDLLFVIDDSSNMTDKQVALANSLPVLISQLNQVEGGLPDLHLGVISSDMGTKASGDATPAPPIGMPGNGGCNDSGKGGNLQVNGAQVTGAFLSDIKLPDGSRQTNYTGQLADVAGTMIRLGTTGCGFEQPLAAMTVALSNNPNNAGFSRTDARLAVVFLTDEDDCSILHVPFFDPGMNPLGPLGSFRCTRFGVTCDDGGGDPMQMNALGPKSGCHPAADSQLLDDVVPIHERLVDLKTDPKDVMVATIAGVLEPFEVIPNPADGNPSLGHSCTFQGPSGPQTADPPVRLQGFLDLFPERAHAGSICQPDLSAELEAIGQLALRTIGTPCLLTPLTDTDVVTPGLQEDCTVEDVVGTDTIGFLDKCGTPPCWSLEMDVATCPAGDHLKLVIDRGTTQPDARTVSRMRCRTDL